MSPETLFYHVGAPKEDVLLWSEETIHVGSAVVAPVVASVELGAAIHRPYSWY
jgi:hypothetical protein